MAVDTKFPPKKKLRRVRVLTLVIWAAVLMAFLASPLPEYLHGLYMADLPSRVTVEEGALALPIGKGMVSAVVALLVLRIWYQPFRLTADAASGTPFAPAGKALLGAGWFSALSIGAAGGWLLLQKEFPVPAIRDAIGRVWEDQWLPLLLQWRELDQQQVGRVLCYVTGAGLCCAGVCLALAVLIFLWRGGGVMLGKLKQRKKRGEKAQLQSVPWVSRREAEEAMGRLEEYQKDIKPLEPKLPAIRICQPAAAGPVQEWLLTQWDESGFLTFRRDNQELIFRKEGEDVFILGSEPLRLIPGMPYEVLVELPVPMRVMTITYIL